MKGRMPRYAARRDDNEPQIVEALESCGFHVARLNGPELPDLLLSRGGRWYVAEVKSSAGLPTAGQVLFRQRARAHVPIFRTVDDVLAFALVAG